MRRSILFKNAFELDLSQWRTAEALRCTAGLALPLLLALWLGQPRWGFLAAIGALDAGLASLNGVSRDRLRLMLTTSLLVALATAGGIWIGGSTPASVLAVTLAAFLLTLYGASGRPASVLGLQVSVALLIMAGLKLPASFALPAGGLALAGGALQTLLFLAVWLLNPRSPERRAVAAVFSELARFVENWGREPHGRLPAAQPLQNAWKLLDDAQQVRSPPEAQAPEHLALRQALRVAETVRAGLVGLAAAGAALRREGDAAQIQAAGALDRALARLLRAEAAKVRRGRYGGPDAGQLRHFQTDVRDWAGRDEPPPLTTELSPPLTYLHWADLLVRALASLAGAAPPAPPQKDPPPEAGVWAQLLAGVRQLPEKLTRPTPALRHALRYGLALGLATLAYKVLSVPHGYWLPLTVALVLRQDYATTLTRGVARFAGTLGGAALATLVVWLAHPSPNVLNVLAVGASWLCFSLLLANYAIFSLGVTLFVVFLITSSGSDPGGVLSLERLLATLLGGVLALGVSLLWPQWQAPQVWEALKKAAGDHLAYGEAVAALGEGGDAEEAASARRAARDSHLAAENTVRSGLLEPKRVPAAHEAQALLERLNTGAAELLSLHAEAGSWQIQGQQTQGRKIQGQREREAGQVPELARQGVARARQLSHDIADQAAKAQGAG